MESVNDDNNVQIKFRFQIDTGAPASKFLKKKLLFITR